MTATNSTATLLGCSAYGALLKHRPVNGRQETRESYSAYSQSRTTSASDNIYYVATGFASYIGKTRLLPQKELLTPSVQKFAPECVEIPGRLFLHSLQFAVRHFAFQLIPNRKGSFQIGVME